MKRARRLGRAAAFFLVAACSSTPPVCPQSSPTSAPPCAGAGSSNPLVAASAVPSAAAAPGPIQAAYQADADRILARATKHHAAFDLLAHLTDRIGHRLAGSAALDRAIAWAKSQLENAGHENVHTEKVMVPHWERGAESAKVTVPQERKLRLLGLGGTVPTPKGGIEAEVVVAASFDELEKLGAAVKDRIVLFDAAMPEFDEQKGSGYGDVVKYRSSGPSRAAKLGAKAVLVRSVTAHSLQTPHTGALNYDKDVAKIPAAAITVEDAEHIARLVRAGEKVKVRLDLASKELPDAPSANVIAELRGREKPDEAVLIGAHIDSWDVGQGAHDDGAGCVMVMQALNDLRALQLKPRRTIRVVLFTNEENGLRGAKAYGEAHKDEVGNLVASFEADIGGYAPRGFNVETTDAKKTAIVGRMTDLIGLLAPLGVKRIDAGFSGADLIPMVKGGALGLGLITDYRHYFDIHHTEADTLDKVDPDELAQSSAAIAVLAYVIADLPERIDAP